MKNNTLLIPLMVILACRPAAEKQSVPTMNNVADTVSEEAAPVTIPDTLLLRNEKQVIFFLPGDEEINWLAEMDKEEGGVIETISDFVYYSSLVCDSLSVRGILCSPVTSPVITAQPPADSLYVFNRKDLTGHITGMMIYDGESAPEIHYGVADYGEWMRIINKKLKLK